jgi:hypothetical protein
VKSGHPCLQLLAPTPHRLCGEEAKRTARHMKTDTTQPFEKARGLDAKTRYAIDSCFQRPSVNGTRAQEEENDGRGEGKRMGWVRSRKGATFAQNLCRSPSPKNTCPLFLSRGRGSRLVILFLARCCLSRGASCYSSLVTAGDDPQPKMRRGQPWRPSGLVSDWGRELLRSIL